MRKLFTLAALVAVMALPLSGWAGCSSCSRAGADYRSPRVASMVPEYTPTAAYAPAPVACAPVCAPQPVACSTKCIPVVPSCYRTVDRPCLSPDLGIGRVLGYMFAPRCMPECQPCPCCP